MFYVIMMTSNPSASTTTTITPTLSHMRGKAEIDWRDRARRLMRLICSHITFPCRFHYVNGDRSICTNAARHCWTRTGLLPQHTAWRGGWRVCHLATLIIKFSPGRLNQLFAAFFNIVVQRLFVTTRSRLRSFRAIKKDCLRLYKYFLI